MLAEEFSDRPAPPWYDLKRKKKWRAFGLLGNGAWRQELLC